MPGLLSERQAKTGNQHKQSRLKRVNDVNPLLLHNNGVRFITERDTIKVLNGKIQMDNFFPYRTRHGANVSIGLKNKVPTGTGFSPNEADNSNHFIDARISLAAGFSFASTASRASKQLAANCMVLPNGGDGFRRIVKAKGKYKAKIIISTQPNDLPGVRWIKIGPVMQKESLTGALHHFSFDQYTNYNRGSFRFRYNSQFKRVEMARRKAAAFHCRKPCPEQALSVAEACW